MLNRRILILAFILILTALLAGLAAHPAQVRTVRAIHAGHAALQTTPAPAASDEPADFHASPVMV